MRSDQRKILAGGLVIIMLMALFPPWRTLRTTSTEIPAVELRAGYSFLLTPPKNHFLSGKRNGGDPKSDEEAADEERSPPKSPMIVVATRIDTGLLLAQWGLVLAATALLILFGREFGQWVKAQSVEQKPAGGGAKENKNTAD